MDFFNVVMAFETFIHPLFLSAVFWDLATQKKISESERAKEKRKLLAEDSI